MSPPPIPRTASAVITNSFFDNIAGTSSAFSFTPIGINVPLRPSTCIPFGMPGATLAIPPSAMLMPATGKLRKPPYRLAKSCTPCPYCSLNSWSANIAASCSACIFCNSLIATSDKAAPPPMAPAVSAPFKPPA